MLRSAFCKRAALGLSALAVGALACTVAAAYLAPVGLLFDLGAQFALTATLGAMLLTLIFLAVRWLGLATVAGSVAAAGMFAVSVPAPLPACPAGIETTRVLFLNMWVRNTDPDETIAFLEESGADIIVLTEISYAFRDKFGELRKLYPFTSNWLDGREWLGMLSRFALTDITQSVKDVEGPRSFEAQTALTPDGELTIVGVHLTRPWPLGAKGEQKRQAAAVARSAAKITGPKIVVGDFNAVTWGTAVGQIETGAGVRPLPSWGTWRSNLPLPLRIPIDQILVGDDFACASKSVGPPLGSDHRPVWVDFALKPQVPDIPRP